VAASREPREGAARRLPSLLASPRRRRRLAWSSALLCVFGAVVLAMITFPGPSEDAAAPAGGGPGWLAPEEPARVTPSRARLAASLEVARRFIRTAVARRHVGDSWSLVSPTMKQGYTRAEWALGEIPIIPYPVDTARWELDYSYADSIGFEVALFPLPGRRTRPTVFNVDLRAFGKGKRQRWLVEGFTPGIVRALPAGSGPDDLASGRRTVAGVDLAPRATGEARLSAAWLAVPFGVLALAIIVPITFGIVHWQRVRRAEQAFARENAER
jgi:hypothetical protein